MDAENSDSEGTGTGACDEYTIVRTLGEGRTSKVKLAKDPNGTQVAIKRYKPNLTMEDYINDELKVMLMLSHPNIMKLISVKKEANWRTAEGKEYIPF
jgi:serine/threonine protein kinase